MKKYLPIATWLVALIVTVGALLYLESDFLWKIQEQNLFMDTSLFFKDQMVVPGGFLSWVGTYLTQYFYYPWLGTLLLSLLWLLLLWLVKRAFQLPLQWSALALVPVGLLLLTIVDMGYWLYMLKLQGHVFVGTLGTAAVAALLWAYRALPDCYGLRPLLIVVTAALGYPMMGIYGLAAALLMGIWSWRLEGVLWKKVVYSLLALACATAVPLICYRLVYYQTNLANIYYAELPLYFITEEYHGYYLPYYLLAAFFLLMIILPLKPLKPVKSVVIQTLTLAVLVAGIVKFWYRDENFHHEVTMQRCMEQCDWQGVLDEAAKQQDEPTRAVVMMRNLALSRLGRLGDEMYLYENGSKAYNAPFGMRLMLVVGPQIYYQYGMLNYCSRLSTENGVEFGWRVDNLKLLAKCALLCGEEQQARRYLNLLKHTTFHADWAEQARTLPELKDVGRMMHYKNTLTSDKGNIEGFLMKKLAESTDTTDVYFQEQALLASLWTKDVNQFWYHFDDYVRLHPNARMPRYYQEAAYLYCMIEGRPTDGMPFDDRVKQAFSNFAKIAELYDNVDVTVAREALQSYRQTYFYDYYLMRQLPEY